jgi:hypothetical protein
VHSTLVPPRIALPCELRQFIVAVSRFKTHSSQEWVNSGISSTSVSSLRPKSGSIGRYSVLLSFALSSLTRWSDLLSPAQPQLTAHGSRLLTHRSCCLLIAHWPLLISAVSPVCKQNYAWLSRCSRCTATAQDTRLSIPTLASPIMENTRQSLSWFLPTLRKRHFHG